MKLLITLFVYFIALTPELPAQSCEDVVSIIDSLSILGISPESYDLLKSKRPTIDNSDLPTSCRLDFYNEYLYYERLFDPPSEHVVDSILTTYNRDKYIEYYISMMTEKVIARIKKGNFEDFNAMLDEIYYAYTKAKRQGVKKINNSLAISIIFADEGRYEESNELLQHRIENTDRKDSSGVFMNFFSLGNNMCNSSNFENAKQAVKMMENYIHQGLDTTYYIEYCLLKGAVYKELDILDTAGLYFNKIPKLTNLDFYLIPTYSQLVYMRSELEKNVPRLKKFMKFDTTELLEAKHANGYLALLENAFINRDQNEFNRLYNKVINRFDTVEIYNKLAWHKVTMQKYCLENFNPTQQQDYIDYIELIKKSNNREIKKSQGNIKIKYENELKEAENLQLKAENIANENKIKNRNILLIGGALAFFLMFKYLYSNYMQNKRIKKYNDELEQKNKKISMLHREAMHRTKNQLVLATNLIANQKRAAENIEAKDIITQSELRLRALASVNKRMASLTDEDNIALKDVIKEIVEGNIYSMGNKNIATEIDNIDTEYPDDKLSLLALIINELSVNSIKHAFHNIEHPRISIDSNIQDGKLHVTYGDNGINNGTEHIDGLGKKLIKNMINQLNGKYIEEIGNGYTFKMILPYE